MKFTNFSKVAGNILSKSLGKMIGEAIKKGNKTPKKQGWLKRMVTNHPNRNSGFKNFSLLTQNSRKLIIENRSRQENSLKKKLSKQTSNLEISNLMQKKSQLIDKIIRKEAPRGFKTIVGSSKQIENDFKIDTGEIVCFASEGNVKTEKILKLLRGESTSNSGFW